MTTKVETADTAEQDFVWTRRHSSALGVLCLAQLIESLDVTVVNVALPAIQSDVGFSTTGLQWVISAYTVLFGGFLLLGGRSGDLFGKRRVFTLGVTLFAVASLLTGVANSAGLLTTGRALQGLSAAFVSPMTLALIAVTFPQGRARNRAFGVWGAVTGVSTSLGVVLGGVLTSGPGWRWIFLINLPIALLLLTGARRYLPADVARTRVIGFDIVGAFLVTAGSSIGVYGCVQTQSHPWNSARTLTLLLVAVTFLVAFILYELKVAANPLVTFGLFRNRSVAGANLVGAFVGAALLAMFYCLSLYEQQVLHYSALKTGLSYLPFTGMLTACAFIAPVLIPKIGMRLVILSGSLFAAAGLVLFSFGTSTGSLWMNVILPSLIVAPGLALTFIPMSMAAVTGVKEEEIGLASGMSNVTRTLGSALGLAVIATFAAATTSDQLSAGKNLTDATSAGYSLGFALCATLMASAACASLVLPGRSSHESAI